MSLFNPWVLLGILMAILSAAGSGYYKGSEDEVTRQQARNLVCRNTAPDSMGLVVQDEIVFQAHLGKSQVHPAPVAGLAARNDRFEQSQGG